MNWIPSPHTYVVADVCVPLYLDVEADTMKEGLREGSGFSEVQRVGSPF